MRKTLIAMLVCASTTPALAAQHWGDFKDNGCVTAKDRTFRVYSSVLWDIPWGQSWEVACANMSATVANVYFSHPTACVKASVVDAVGIAGAVLGFGGLVYPPAGVVGTVIGAAAIAMDKGGVGALNMWGVFYVQVPKC